MDIDIPRDTLTVITGLSGSGKSSLAFDTIYAEGQRRYVDRVLALPEGTRLPLLAPVVRGRKGEYRKELAEWQRAGFQRVRIDRLVVRDDIATRLAESFETALKLADGLAYIDPVDTTAGELVGSRVKEAPQKCAARTGTAKPPASPTATRLTPPNPRIVPLLTFMWR